MNSSTKKETATAGGWFLILLGLVSIAVFGLRTISSSTFWMHLASGRWIAENGIPRIDTLTFTSAGSAWVGASWLYDRVLFVLWGIGHSGLLIVLHTALLVAAFCLLTRVARRWADPVSLMLALILAAWLIAPRFVVGPSVVALFFCALFIYVLSVHRKAWVVWVIVLPVQWLWTNMHPSFLLGSIVLVAFAIEAWLRVRSAEPSEQAGLKKKAMSLSSLLVIALLVTLANPYAAALHGHALKLGTTVAAAYVREWISPMSSQFKGAMAVRHLVTLALLIGAGGLVTERRRLPIAITSLAVVSAFLAVRSLWYIDFFAVLAFPFLALSLCALGGFVGDYLKPVLKENSRLLVKVTAAVGILLACATVLYAVSGIYYVRTGSFSSFGLGAAYDLHPNAAAEILQDDAFPERAFNVLPDGGFLLWRYPERSVFIDQRATVHGEDVFAALNRCMAGADGAWMDLEDKWDPGAVILNCTVPGAGQAARSLLEKGDWTLAYFDGSTAILLRSTSANQALVANEELQAAGLDVLDRERERYANRLGGYKSPGNSPRLIGAGNLYMALGRYPEAKTVYELLTRGTPTMAAGWVNLGLAEMQVGNLDAAKVALERAARLMPKNIWPLLQLSRVYVLEGDFQGEKAMLDRARKINAKAVSAFLAMEKDATTLPQQ